MNIEIEVFNDVSRNLIDKLEKYDEDINLDIIRFDYLRAVNSSRVGNLCVGDIYKGEVDEVIDTLFWNFIGDCYTNRSFKVLVVRCLGEITDSDLTRLIVGLMKLTNNYTLRVAIICDEKYTKALRKCIYSISKRTRSNDKNDTIRKFKRKKY